MMAKIKTKEQGTGMMNKEKGINKRYKISSREMILMEEEKRKREDEKRKKEEEKKERTKLPEDFFQRKPKKSILKGGNNTQQQQVDNDVIRAQKMFMEKKREQQQQQQQQQQQLQQQPVKRPASERENVSSSKKAKLEEPDKEADPDDPEGGSIPEGFFDDPVKDAKARNIEYKDPAEEEWERFRKEINQELDTAHDIVVEEQQEATAGRQLEEIDEQMRAWSRVSEMEKKKDVLNEVVNKKMEDKDGDEEGEGGESEQEEDLEDMMDWRKKC